MAAAIAVSVASGAVLFWTVGELQGDAEHAYEAAAIVLAVVVLTWMVFWMRGQARTLASELRKRVGAAALGGSTFALAAVAFAREGIESSLFLFTATEQSTPLAAAVGGSLGTLVAIAVGVIVYRGAARLDLRQFFIVTSLALFAFAAYLLVTLAEVLGETGLQGGTGIGVVLAVSYAAVVGTAYLWPSAATNATS